LRTLGDEVELLSLTGRDPLASLVEQALERDGLPAGQVLPILGETPQSVILHDGDGRRQIHVDLKDVQQVPYPAERQGAALARCQAAFLCNVEFSRPLVGPARQAGTLVVTDVQAVRDLDDPYDLDFLRAAHLLFLSEERLVASLDKVAREALAHFPAEVVVIGMGAAGALLATRGDGLVGRFPARSTRPVVNTIGAGDALLSASRKFGVAGAAEGFLDRLQLDAMAIDEREA